MNARHIFAAIPLMVGLAAPMASHGAGQTAGEVEDLGVIAPASSDGKSVGGKAAPPPEPPPKRFRANVSFRSDYTSNAKLSGDHGSGDVLFFPSLEAGYHTDLGNGFAFDIAAHVESALYSRFDERAFISYNIPTELEWRPQPKAPRIYIGVEPYRFDSFDTGDRITQAIGLSVGTDNGYSFNNGNSLVFGGYNFSHYFSDPTIDNRSTHRVSAGLAHQFRPQLYGQILYTWQFSDFHNVNRDDSKHAVALSLIYQFNTHLFGSVGGAFVDNDSTSRRASYQAATGSVGVTWQF